MSTIESSRVEPKPGSEADPFRYGWRYVVRRQPSGRLGREQIPLTLEDLLFPEEGDFAVQLPLHINDCLCLKIIFDNRLAGDPEALVLTDCRVDYNIPGVRPLGPDIAVFLGVPNDFNRGTLKIAEDSAALVLVVEVTSPDTRKNDFNIKKDFYHRAGVPLYIIVDARPGRKGRRVKLHGFRHTPEGYESIPLDDQGRLWVEPMEIWMAIENARVVCYDGRTGERIGDYGEQVQAKEEWRARAETEARAKDEWRAIAETEARTREAETRIRLLVEERAAKAEEIAEERARLIATQDRLIELGDQISDALRTKLREAEDRARDQEAELRRFRGEG
jgi:colicin import membrane protein